MMMRDWTGSIAAVAVAAILTLAAQTASAAFITTEVTFSDLSTGDFNSVPAAYQPVAGLQITWNGVTRYGTYNYDGYDHTSAVDSGAPSKLVGSYTQTNLNQTHAWSITFDQSVDVTSMWLCPANGQNTVTVNGYAAAADVSPVITLTLPYTSFPGSGWSHDPNYFASWMQVTGLAGTSVQRVEFVTKNTGWNNNFTGVVLDDMTVAPVPEPASIALLAIGCCLAIRRRRVG